METINHECYVSPEVAKLLEQAGFDWEVNHSYPNVSALDNSCSGYMEDLSFYHNLNDGKYGGLSAPTLEVAQRWLREVKGLIVQIDFLRHNKWWYLVLQGERVETLENPRVKFNTYEEAQEAGIKKVLEIILEKVE